MMSVGVAADLAPSLLFLAAGGCAIPGWVTNRPDSAARYTWRLCSWIAWGGAFVSLLLTHPPLWLAILEGANFGIAYSRTRHWWRLREMLRRLDSDQASGGAA